MEKRFDSGEKSACIGRERFGKGLQSRLGIVYWTYVRPTSRAEMYTKSHFKVHVGTY